MTNGLSVKDQSDFKQLYEDDPALAMGLLFQNISDLKAQCACRLETCRIQQSKDRRKNMTLQAASGVVGGAVAAWVFIKGWFEVIADK